MAPVRDGANWIEKTTKAMDAVQTALVLVRAKPRPGNNHATPILIQIMSVTVGTDMIHMTAERAPTTSIDSTLTNATTITTAIGIAAVTAQGHTVEAGAQRKTN